MPGFDYSQNVTLASYLGSVTRTSDFTTASTTAVQVTSMSVAVIVPGSGHVKISFSCQDIQNSVGTDYVVVTIWDGTVGSGTQLMTFAAYSSAAGINIPAGGFVLVSPGAGSKTYNLGLHALVGGTAKISASSTAPTTLLVEYIS